MFLYGIIRQKPSASFFAAKMLWLRAHRLQQLARRFCVQVLHYRQQHPSGSFGIGLGLVVVKLVADMRRQRG